MSTRLPLYLASELQGAAPPLRALLTYLALSETPLGRRVVKDLWAKHSHRRPSPPPRFSPCAVAAGVASTPFRARPCGTPSSEVATAELDTRRRELLAALERHPSADSVLDRVRLQLETGNPRAALHLLETEWEGLSAETRFSAQAFVRQALDLDPQLAEEDGTRNTIALLLERGPDAVHVARQLADAFPTSGPHLTAVLQVAEVLEDGSNVDASLHLLDRHQDATGATPAQRCLLNVRRALLYLRQNRLDPARAAFKAARVDYKDLVRSAQVDGIVTAEYLSVRAGLRFSAGAHPTRIEHLLRKAARAARLAQARLLGAQISNNLGITMSRAGEMKRARGYLRRSLRLKKTLGDFKGVAASTLNLARAHLRSGQVLSATKYSIDCVHRTQRYGLHDVQISALRLLADAYDRQHRPTLALDTLLRAWRMASSENSTEVAGRVAWDLAPLAAVVGRPDIVDAVAPATRSLGPQTPNQWTFTGTALPDTASIAYLHQGQHASHHRSLRRAYRRSSALAPERLDGWSAFSSASARAKELEVEDRRAMRAHVTTRALPMRYLCRVHNWYRRA